MYNTKESRTECWWYPEEKKKGVTGGLKGRKTLTCVLSSKMQESLIPTSCWLLAGWREEHAALMKQGRAEARGGRPVPRLTSFLNELFLLSFLMIYLASNCYIFFFFFLWGGKEESGNVQVITYGGFQWDAVFEMCFHELVEVRVFLAAPVQIMTSYTCLWALAYDTPSVWKLL